MFKLYNKTFFKDFTSSQIKILKSLNTPSKIQTFLNKIPINFEESGDTCMSPKSVLEKRKAHCMEGAMFAAATLRFHGEKPLIMDFESTSDDFDHVIAIFKRSGFYGSISKTNHAVLRYREPIYRTLRELALSFFHEYFLNKNGKKTLRTFSKPINLSRFDNQNWMTSKENVWFIPEHLTKIPHKSILNKAQIRSLRLADEIERQAGKLLEYKKIKEK